MGDAILPKNNAPQPDPNALIYPHVHTAGLWPSSGIPHSLPVPQAEKLWSQKLKTQKTQQLKKTDKRWLMTGRQDNDQLTENQVTGHHVPN